MNVSDSRDDPVQLHEIHTAAKKMAVSKDTIKRLIAAGDLIAVNVSTGGRPSYRIAEHELKRFITAREMTGKNEAPPPREGTPRNSEASHRESA